MMVVLIAITIQLQTAASFCLPPSRLANLTREGVLFLIQLVPRVVIVGDSHFRALST